MDAEKYSFAQLTNLAFLESLYESYQADPESVDPSWRHFFEGMDFAALSRPGGGEGASADLRIYHLIEAYRTYGHLHASFNPLLPTAQPEVPELSLNNLGFKEAELSTPFPTCGFLKNPEAPLKEILEALQATYCNKIGIEYIGLGEPELEKWVQNRIEPQFDLQLTAEQKLSILKDINKSELFEVFLHTKYVGQKRFSLEGGETLIPMMTAILAVGGDEGVANVVIGMAHRGRLNVLANILNKSYAQIFSEFEDHYSTDLIEGTGDVKYHKGFKGEVTTAHKQTIHATLSANASHLESVDPVVEGQVRALQDLYHKNKTPAEVVPILIHGDAAIAGQGVVYETLQMSKLNGYGTGGTLHIVINNQIGFTTLPKDAKSTRYCTDIARAFGAPVFHVNAEDPEGCVAVAKIAMQIRQKFHCDVFIDLNCYRKYGHNEGDEPNFTQPIEYQAIRSKKSIREIFRDQLIQEGVLTKEEAEREEAQFKTSLNEALQSVKSSEASPAPSTPPKTENLFVPASTAVPYEKLKALAEKCCKIPQDFHVHPKVKNLFDERLKMVEGNPAEKNMNWGMGEYLAYATLADQGIDIRISGQDSRRGTFSHRHALIVDQADQKKYFPLSHLKEGQGLCDVFNSHLSEFAVLGFEFGYSLAHPQALVIWEAQYGDFSNGGQVIIDQYISSSEQKWSHRSNLTLLLPHGYEGQGPEHSSARLERFLQLCGDDNLQIVNCTTPAQLFHLLRRQALRTIKKPLIIFSPKALLRHPLCVSAANELTQGTFQEILDDPNPALKPRKLLLCTGKIFYDLLAEREKRKADDITIIRIEQLYPLNRAQLEEVFKRYQGFSKCLWVQEEHSNMGAWDYIRPNLEELLKGSAQLRYAGRGRSAATAVGSYKVHQKQQAALLEEVFK